MEIEMEALVPSTRGFITVAESEEEKNIGPLTMVPLFDKKAASCF